MGSWEHKNIYVVYSVHYLEVYPTMTASASENPGNVKRVHWKKWPLPRLHVFKPP